MVRENETKEDGAQRIFWISRKEWTDKIVFEKAATEIKRIRKYIIQCFKSTIILSDRTQGKKIAAKFKRNSANRSALKAAVLVLEIGHDNACMWKKAFKNQRMSHSKVSFHFSSVYETLLPIVWIQMHAMGEWNHFSIRVLVKRENAPWGAAILNSTIARSKLEAARIDCFLKKW